MKEKINTFCSKIQFLSGASLKLIAILSMLIDHANKALIYPNLTSNNGALTVVSNLFDIIGRIAFPLFCFFVVEGYFKTRNRKKYLMNLLIFGVISEVPFDMFTTASFFNMNWNNVMFTLALVLVTIWIIDVLKEKMQNRPKVLWYIVSWIIILLMCAVAMILALDYEHHAIFDRLFLLSAPRCAAPVHPLWLCFHVYPALGTFGLWTDAYIQRPARQAEQDAELLVLSCSSAYSWHAAFLSWHLGSVHNNSEAAETVSLKISHNYSN